MNKFIVHYEDNTQLIGDAFKSDWKKVDDTKKIVKFEYIFDNSMVVLEGYKEYNHLLECVSFGKKGIEKIFLMGRKEETDIIVFDLKKNNLYKDVKPYGEEYGNQILAGWNPGLLNNPNCKLMKKKDV